MANARTRPASSTATKSTAVRDSQPGRSLSVDTHASVAVSIQRDSFQFVAGSYVESLSASLAQLTGNRNRWNTVTQIIVLNSDPSTNGVANGQLTVYAGQTLAFELKNLVFRVDSSVTLSNFIFASAFYAVSSLAFSN